MPGLGFGKGLSPVRVKPITGIEKVAATNDAFYVLTKTKASLPNSKIHPNTGGADPDVKHDESDVTFDSSTGHAHTGTDSTKVDHVNLDNIGTNTHSQIDTHISDASVHFTKPLSHTDAGDISNVGSNTHATIDDHLSDTVNPHTVTLTQAQTAGNIDAESLTTSLTSGSVVFSDGSNLSQDNDNLFWDNTAKEMGIGNKNPKAVLHVSDGSSGQSTPAFGTRMIIESSNEILSALQFLTPNDSLVGMYFGDPQDADAGYFLYDHGDDEFIWRTDGNTPVDMTLTKLGRLGVNENNPDAMMEIVPNATNIPVLHLKAIASQTDVIFKCTDSNDANLLTINETGRLLIPAGTESLPALTFHLDNDIGFYRIEANKMGLTAGGALKMTLADDIGIGTSSPLGTLHIDQTSTTGAKPVLLLDQADISEEFIKFVGAAAASTLTQSIVAEADVTTATRQGFLKVEVDDKGNQITDQAYFIPIFTLA